MNNSDDFIVVKSKRERRNDKEIQKFQDKYPHGLFKATNDIFTNKTTKSNNVKIKEKDQNVNLWLKFQFFINLNHLWTRIKNKYKLKPTKIIGDFDECAQFFIEKHTNKCFVDGKLTDSDLNQKMILVAKTYRCCIHLISANSDIEDINIPGTRKQQQKQQQNNGNDFDTSANTMHLLHAGFNQFMLLFDIENNHNVDINKTQFDDLLSVKSVNISNDIVLKRNFKVDQDKKKLEKLQEVVQGKEFYEDSFSMNSKKVLFYDIAKKDINKSKLISCQLRLHTAHSGKAIPINRSLDILEIELIGRKNCGYNAFDGDTVLVELYDKERSIGRVISVEESQHKPVNSLYLCTVCQDQGSLMRPLNNFFPKIHVENIPGRDKYFKSHKKSRSPYQNISSDFGNRRTLEADNTWYSLYDIYMANGEQKVQFYLSTVERFDPSTCTNIFVVCYEYWDPHFLYPNGRIVGVLSASSDRLQDNLHIIKSICNISTIQQQHKSLNNELKIISSKIDNSNKLTQDLTRPVIFTIDNSYTRDMDDALSYFSTDRYIFITIYITDVAKYMSSTYSLFDNAIKQSFTYYLPHDYQMNPWNLFPKDLSEDLFSLIPQKSRSTLAVTLRFDANNLDKPPCKFFFADTIVSDYKLSYQDVNLLLDHQDESKLPNDPRLIEALKVCFMLSKRLRIARMPKNYYALDSDKNYHCLNSQETLNAQRLIEEFMILTNRSVAEFIYEQFDYKTLLRVQQIHFGQTEEERLLEHINNSLSRRIELLRSLPEDFTKNCLTISKQLYGKLKQLHEQKDYQQLQTLLRNDDYINQCVFSKLQVNRKLNQAKYSCSLQREDNGVIPKENHHFSLNLQLYTHFTSPIRRLPDILVQKLLRFLINADQVDSINEQDVRLACGHANRNRVFKDNFEHICNSYSIFNQIQYQNCLMIDCVVKGITDDFIEIEHKILVKSKSDSRIHYKFLELNEVPTEERNETEKTRIILSRCVLNWKRLIFSMNPSKINANNSNITSCFNIPSNNYSVILTDRNNWNLLDKIREQHDFENLHDKVERLLNKFKIEKFNSRISSDLLKFGDPTINICYPIELCQSLRVQLGKYRNHSMLELTPQLLMVCDTLQVCLLHKRDPILCFTPDITHQLYENFKLNFNETSEYKMYFSPLLLLETVSDMMSSDIEFTLTDVQIKWFMSNREQKYFNCKDIYGMFFLEPDFCFERNIHYTDQKSIISNGDKYTIKEEEGDKITIEMKQYMDDEDDEAEIHLEYIMNEALKKDMKDLVCIRAQIDQDNAKEGDKLPVWWTAHASVVATDIWTKNDTTKEVIIIHLTKSEFDLFENVPNWYNLKFTVDLYLQSLPSRRRSKALTTVKEDSFLGDVVLNDLELSYQTYTSPLLMDFFSMHPCNELQQRAIKMATTNKFSLIWGPPGTGKTYVGCLISKYFASHHNKEKEILLYTGPSNDSVNVVANEMYNRFGLNAPHMLRIYGKSQENVDFPVPGHHCKSDIKPLDPNGFLARCSIHFLIRDPGMKYAEQLEEFNNYFGLVISGNFPQNDEEFSQLNVRKRVQQYNKLLHTAKAHYIVKNVIKMVLCTVVVSYRKIIRGFNIRQVIVDEAGMCVEPETLIPLNYGNVNAENLILIGDHKQLRPILKNQLATRKGLGMSLFERYWHTQPELTTMLKQQYRMHPSICVGPSNYFYDGNLETMVSSKWTCLNPSNLIDPDQYNALQSPIDRALILPNCLASWKNSQYNVISDDYWRSMQFDQNDNLSLQSINRVRFFNVPDGEEIVQSIQSKSGNENSRANEKEVNVVGYIYKALIRNLKLLRPGLNGYKHVTVLTQYQLQQNKLLRKCQSILKLEGIENAEPLVQTVVRSQGSENDYVILSTVRSLANPNDIAIQSTPGWERKYLGFITDQNQINVALTRARMGLFIVGNANLLRANHMWKSILDDLNQRNCLLDSPREFHFLMD